MDGRGRSPDRSEEREDVLHFLPEVLRSDLIGDGTDSHINVLQARDYQRLFIILFDVFSRDAILIWYICMYTWSVVVTPISACSNFVILASWLLSVVKCLEGIKKFPNHVCQ